MATLNAGVPIRFENKGVILFGADDVLNIKEGTMEITIAGYEPIRHTDRGILTSVLAGNERPCKVKFDVKYTSIVDTDGLLAKLFGALATNKVKNRNSDGTLWTFPVSVKVYNTPDGITGETYVFAKCFLPDGLSIKAASGADSDSLSITLENFELSPTVTAF